MVVVRVSIMHRIIPLNFRTATVADISAVVALVESAFRGEASRAGWTTEADLLDGQRTDALEIGGIISGPRSRIRLAEQANALVGCVRIEAEAEYGYIGMVSVQPTLQSGGIGRQLLAEAERVIREELRLPRARMTVIGQRDTLLAWYVRRGYSSSGERKPFPYEDRRAGRARRDDLFFEVLQKDLT